jgi:Cu(I)/Ag(I) efflux system membrane fusion protein
VPVEVKVGREGGGLSEITEGLAEGEQVVASGQFLVDSEANLRGLEGRLDAAAAANPPARAPAKPVASPAAHDHGGHS